MDDQPVVSTKSATDGESKRGDFAARATTSDGMSDDEYSPPHHRTGAPSRLSPHLFTNDFHANDSSDVAQPHESDRVNNQQPDQPAHQPEKPKRFPAWPEHLFSRASQRPPAYSALGFEEKAKAKNLHASPDILLAHAVEEADREPLYQLDLLRMFRQRLQLNAILGLLLVPLFHLFYVYLSPAIAQQTQLMHGLLAGVCMVYLVLCGRVRTLLSARLLTVSGYTLVCMGASVVMIILSQNQFESASITGLQLAMLAAHSQILLSVVLLPLSLWEGIIMAAIVTVSLAWTSWWPATGEGGSIQTSQIFVLLTTAVFVLCVTHFQAVLRRRAFDAAFDLARSAAQLQTLSTLDAVTSGFNRLYLERILATEINRAVRFERPLSIMMFDLDNFKSVNDTHGHTTGDEVLRIVNDASVVAIRDVDTIARYGGDEFMVVLPETEQEDALVIATRLQETVQEKLKNYFDPKTPRCDVTLSIGLITLHPTQSVGVENIITLADERLYEAKRMGKNRIAV